MPNGMPKGSALAAATVACVVACGIWHSAAFATRDCTGRFGEPSRSSLDITSERRLAFGIEGLSADSSRDVIYRVLIAEEARAPDPASLQIIVDAMRHADPAVRAVAARALGRLERPALIDHIEPLVDAPEADVRSAAANALGQALFGSPPDRTREPRARVTGILIHRLESERSPEVRGTLARTLGRLDYETEEEVRRAESPLVASLGGPAPELEGALRGLEHLFRLRYGKMAPAAVTIEGLRAVAVKMWPTVGAVFETERLATIRRLAVKTLRAAGALDAATAEAAFRDADWQVRHIVVSSGAFLLQGLKDLSPHVRFEVARTASVSEKLCSALRHAARDPDPHVARQAIVRLGWPCYDGHEMTEAVALAAELARRRRAVSRTPWQIASAALGALAKACGQHHADSRGCAAAAGLVRAHAADRLWEVRMYAAAAAAAIGELSVVRHLAKDTHPNVRDAAIRTLATSGIPEDRPLIVEALSSDDYQLVRSAARALYGSREPAIVEALTAAFKRLRAKQSDTARDTLMEIRDSLRGAGIELLEPDPDPTPRSVPFTRAELDELLARERRAIVVMRSGGSFELRLLPQDAPATVARFIRLARRRAYDGLTFHRVEPNFVIQGGSPGANEYAGHDPYLRDEVGLISHTRGTAGISTRGRDTGDAQIFVNLVDNPRLDHRYTVFARVTRGMAVIDRILEGDVIARIVIR
jgi:cyclophilin family peptidyl-prolyl cis-trans isomerase